MLSRVLTASTVSRSTPQEQEQEDTPPGGGDRHLLTYTPGNSPHTVYNYGIGSDIAPEQGGGAQKREALFR